MIKDHKQDQDGGDHSTNLQGQNITINQGISYADAKQIALDVYKENFIALSESAAESARARAEELTEAFLTTLNERNREAIKEMSEPGMQAALYEAQKQYAKTGDKDLQGLLVDILVDRAGRSDRDIQQIVLDESLEVASKLTVEQMDALSLNFLLSRTRNLQLTNLDAVNDYIRTSLLPFLGTISDSSSTFEHLQYAGCGSIMQIGNIHPVERIFRVTYPGLFCKGFTKDQFNEHCSEIPDADKLLMPCFHDSSLWQFRVGDEQVLEQEAAKLNIEEENWPSLKKLFNEHTMSDDEIRTYLLGAVPEIQELFDLWANSNISKFGLTTVGIAIAHANFRRRTGNALDLSIWVR